MIIRLDMNESLLYKEVETTTGNLAGQGTEFRMSLSKT